MDKKYRETGSALIQPIPGPTDTVSTEENVERARDSVLSDPRRSEQKHSAILSFPKLTQNCFYPYKIQLVQVLKENNCFKKTFKKNAERILAVFSTQRRLNNVISSEEIHFLLEGM